MRDGMTVRRIEPRAAQSVSIQNHYLHRECPCSVAYGLFVKSELKGVAIYGCPASSTLKKLCGEDEQAHVTELKRLWVAEDVKNYPESYLVSESLKQMKKDVPDLDIVISYADTEYGHTGVIYQATNWLYTGTSIPYNDILLVGNDKDQLSQRDMLIAKYGSMPKAIEALGEDAFYHKTRSLKHRYVFFNGRTRKRNRVI